MTDHWCKYCNGVNAHNCQFNPNLPRTKSYTTNTVAISDDKALLRQALEALEELQYAVVDAAATEDVSLYYRAIVALRAALAEPTCKQSLQVEDRSGGMGSQEYAMTVEQAARDFFCWFNRHYHAPSSHPDHEWNRLGVALANHLDEAQPAAVDGAIDKARFERAPCYLCGYNGPGYYRPDTHPCAAKYHAALEEIAEALAEAEANDAAAQRAGEEAMSKTFGDIAMTKLARYEPEIRYVGTGEYVAECVHADGGEYYLAADVDAEIEALWAEVKRLRADLAESDEIREKLGHLLKRIAAALKGEPPEGTWHSWHDLPEKAAQLVERVQRDEALLRQALKALELFAWDTLSGRNAAYAIREHLGLEEEQA